MRLSCAVRKWWWMPSHRREWGRRVRLSLNSPHNDKTHLFSSAGGILEHERTLTPIFVGFNESQQVTLSLKRKDVFFRTANARNATLRVIQLSHSYHISFSGVVIQIGRQLDGSSHARRKCAIDTVHASVADSLVHYRTIKYPSVRLTPPLPRPSQARPPAFPCPYPSSLVSGWFERAVFFKEGEF